MKITSITWNQTRYICFLVPYFSAQAITLTDQYMLCCLTCSICNCNCTVPTLIRKNVRFKLHESAFNLCSTTVAPYFFEMNSMNWWFANSTREWRGKIVFLHWTMELVSTFENIWIQKWSTLIWKKTNFFQEVSPYKQLSLWSVKWNCVSSY